MQETSKVLTAKALFCKQDNPGVNVTCQINPNKDCDQLNPEKKRIKSCKPAEGIYS